MNKQEYKAWWRDTRIEARKEAQKHFSDSIVCVNVPYITYSHALTIGFIQVKKDE